MLTSKECEGINQEVVCGEKNLRGQRTETFGGYFQDPIGGWGWDVESGDQGESYHD